jgi:hypothetical protein
MSNPIATSAERAMAAVLIALALGPQGACKGRSTGAIPSATSEVSARPPAAGFRRVITSGWSIDLPVGFARWGQSQRQSNLIWLVHQRDDRAPGAPRVMLARHAKPATFESRVFGLTALDALHKAADKRVLASKQHTVAGIDVTDIEVLAGKSPKARVQWRRLFVHDHVAYTLTYSIAEAEAERHRPTARAVLASLRPQPNEPESVEKP